jgi:hypothetical protein
MSTLKIAALTLTQLIKWRNWSGRASKSEHGVCHLASDIAHLCSEDWNTTNQGMSTEYMSSF